MPHTPDPDLTYLRAREVLTALPPGSAVLDRGHLYWERHPDGWWCYGEWERSAELTPVGPHHVNVIPLPAVLLPPKESTP